ncbi:MAG: hypothetical protein H0X34_18100 [Chthoniobacterales bacterium]|nr:hypothetical protein [Chthoniobacterales bacterium]
MLALLALWSCGGSGDGSTGAEAAPATGDQVARSLREASTLIRSNDGLCALLSPQVLRNVFTQAGELGRAKCRAVADQFHQAPIVRFHVIAVNGGRARARFVTADGPGVTTLERIDGRWLVTFFSGYGGG